VSRVGSAIEGREVNKARHAAGSCLWSIDLSLKLIIACC